MPGTAVTKSVVANDPSGRRREEIFVDIIEKISVTFSSSVSNYSFASLLYHVYGSLDRLYCIIMLFSGFLNRAIY